MLTAMNVPQSIVVLLAIVALAAAPWVVGRALRHDRDQGICICPTCDGSGRMGEGPLTVGVDCPECGGGGRLL